MTLGDGIVALEGGHAEQINMPMNLSWRRRNTIVLAFIRSPSMNLSPDAILARPGVTRPEFRAADNAFSVVRSGEWSQRLVEYGGRAVILGARPEDIEIAPNGMSGSTRVATMRVRLDAVEPLGSEAFLSTRIGAKEITARAPLRGSPAAGSEVELVLNRERLHFFHAGSGETLWVELHTRGAKTCHRT